jgi:cytoskeleton protein RodZ
MQTTKLGQILEEERQKQRITLQQMAQLTQIKLEYLQALEKNQFDRLPPTTFVKGYLKAYARELKLDQQSLLAILRRDYPSQESGQLLSNEFTHPVKKKRQWWQPVTLTVLTVGVIFLTLLGYVVWQWFSLNRPPSLVIFKPEANQFVSSQIEVNGQTSTEAMVSVNAQPVAIQPDGSFSTQLYLPREGISTITIEAVDQQGRSSIEQRTVYVRF